VGTITTRALCRLRRYRPKRPHVNQHSRRHHRTSRSATHRPNQHRIINRGNFHRRHDYNAMTEPVSINALSTALDNALPQPLCRGRRVSRVAVPLPRIARRRFGAVVQSHGSLLGSDERGGINSLLPQANLRCIVLVGRVSRE